MFKRRSADQRYPQKQAIHRLTWLAKNMVRNTQTVFSIERMQPDWLPTPLQRCLYIIGVMLLTSLPIGLLVGWGSGFLLVGRVFEIGIGLATGLAVCLAVRRAFGLIGTLMVGSAFGLAFGITFEKYDGIFVACYVGLAVGLAAGGTFGLVGRRLIGRAVTSWEHVDIIEMLNWSWSKAMFGLVVGLIAGSVFGFTIGQAIWKSIASSFGVAFGIAGGVTAGLLSGLTGSEVETRTSPNQGIWRSVRNATFIGIGRFTGRRAAYRCGDWTGVEGLRLPSGLTVGATIGLTLDWRLALPSVCFRRPSCHPTLHLALPSLPQRLPPLEPRLLPGLCRRAHLSPQSRRGLYLCPPDADGILCVVESATGQAIVTVSLIPIAPHSIRCIILTGGQKSAESPAPRLTPWISR